MQRLRVGVVGVGHLGRHHARILAGIPGVHLVGVVDSRPEQARAVAEPLNARVFSSHLELAEEVDAVSIAAPTSLHHELARPFLEKGIPTLIEKPLAASISQAESLVKAAQQSGALLQVGHIERFNPAITALERQGWTPKYIHAERQGLFTFRSTDVGVVLDLMIHDIDLLLSIQPAPVKHVSAVGLSLFGEHEDVATAHIEFENGCVAHLTASRASYQASRKMRVWACEGYATLDFATKKATLVQPSESLLRGDLALEGVDLTQPAAVREHLFGKVLRVDQAQGPGADREALSLELEAFVSAILTESTPRVSGQDGLRAMILADRIVQSLRAHQWEGRPDGPVGPRGLIVHAPQSGSAVPPPKSWKIRRNANSLNQDSHS